ncbi:hypothetical protein [Olleya namhaensis]|uniref:hypothetical protein n=1 Tax=Olleya namhaensis TaxID=1144750 RepID=UPI00232E4C03|nr:hypothetical protein [Olleya namhaensis]
MGDLETIKKKVSTKPAVSGGANFETHVLSQTRYGFKFKPSLGFALFTLLFVSVAYAFLYAGIALYIKTQNFDFIFSLVTLVGTMFFIAGNYLLISYFSPIVFNKHSNRFYRGFNKHNSKKSTVLSNIVALQIIGETISGENGNYKSFELNLVLKDASRINVVDHGKLKTIIIDTEVLSKHFNIPIWHATS